MAGLNADRRGEPMERDLSSIRPGRDRRRARRLRRGDPRRPARHEGRLRREARRRSAAPASTSAASRSKALLQSRELFDAGRHDFADHGIKVGGVELDLAAMHGAQGRGRRRQLTDGVAFLFKKNKVDLAQGHRPHRRRRHGRRQVRRRRAGRSRPKHILIATGSEASPLPGVDVDEKTIVASTGALAFDEVPEHLVVVGGGYIGLELGSVWRAARRRR